MNDGMERLRYAWHKATTEERVAFLKEIHGPGGKGDIIDIRSMVGISTLEPAVTLQWQEKHFQMSPETASQHAIDVIECAAAAEHDAFFVRYLTQEVGVPLEKAFEVIVEMRGWRQRRAEMPEDPEGLTG